MSTRINDAFYTPDALAAACAARIQREGNVGYDSVIWEPHAGKGAFTRAFAGLGYKKILASDIDLTYSAEWGIATKPRQVNFLLTTPAVSVDWIVGNPPFTDAIKHVEHALKIATIGVAFVLPIQFIASQARVDFWTRHPLASFNIINKRPSFTEGGNDMRDVALYIWSNNHKTAPVLRHHLNW